MSGFSSLLNQFKQTTQQATSLSNTSRGGQTTSSTTNTTSSSGNKKRTRSIFEAATTNNQGTKTSNNTTISQQHNKQYKYPTKPIKTIYIACPAYTETGGPEALHQLCHMINVGEYTYEVDDDNDDVTKEVTKCDEFGRALFTKDDRKPSTVASNNNDTTKTTEQQQPKKKVIKAYMLYLRERNNNTVEHITSSNAKSIKYNKYNAPPISSSIDNSMTLFLQQRKREVDVSYTIDGVHGNKTKEKNEEKKEESEEEREEYTSELIIWPECWTHLIDSLQPPSIATTSNNSSQLQQQQQKQEKKYQIAIWWLSVNNNNGRFLPNQFQLRKDVLHLVQSKYAKSYVEGMLKSGTNMKGTGNLEDDILNVMNMSEFISYASASFAPTILNNNNDSKEGKEVVRDVDVVYNTAKGQHYTDEIIKRAVGKTKPNALDGSVVGGGLKFHPIGKGHGGRERMTEKEVVALLKRSKVVRFSSLCV